MVKSIQDTAYHRHPVTNMQSDMSVPQAGKQSGETDLVAEGTWNVIWIGTLLQQRGEFRCTAMLYGGKQLFIQVVLAHLLHRRPTA